MTNERDVEAKQEEVRRLLRDVLDVVNKISLGDLTRLATHEYDDPGTLREPHPVEPAASFLKDVKRNYLDRVWETGSFDAALRTDLPPRGGYERWHVAATSAELVHAYADLGLIHSYWSASVNLPEMTVPHLRALFVAIVEQVEAGLCEEYGPEV